VDVLAVKTRAGEPAAGSAPASDLLLALLVGALLLIGSGVSLHDDFRIQVSQVDDQSWLRPEVLVLVLAGSLPLAFRRIAPLTVFAVIGAASLGYQALGYSPELLPLGVIVALYTVAVRRRPLVSGVAAAVYVVGLSAGALLHWTSLDDDQFFVDLVAIVGTVSIGYGVALTRTRASLAEQRAADLARSQDERMRAAMEQEQARIAREVHDIVAHDVTVIVAQAAAARRVFDDQPQTAASALASVEELGRDALDGVRRLVGLLRTDDEAEERAPQPTLERLPLLAEQVRRAGHAVTLKVTGSPYRLPATVELNAYRIVQEALTNSLKHADPTSTTVLLEYLPDEVRIEVRDRSGARTKMYEGHPSARYGLLSMQQRAALLGGRLEAGPYDDGFRVAARLPVGARSV
jgi:signal transduction histidine kinase